MIGRSRLGSALLCFAAACGADGAARPDVVLVSIDTLRADALSCYGNPLPTSPHLDALAAEGFLFEQAFAPVAATAPSHATLFTGLGPWVHRVENLRVEGQPTPALDDAFTTLAERFRDAGYETAAFTDGGPLGKVWNLHQGFDVHVGKLEGVEHKVDAALDFLARRDAAGSASARPLFLFVHTYQTHVPYHAPLEWSHRFTPDDYDGVLIAAEADVRTALADGTLEPDGKILLRDKERFTDRDIDYLRKLYYGEVAFTDHHLERLWSALRADGSLDRAVVVVTSDHGEEFGEHGMFGHKQLHSEALHVPLILRLPRSGSFSGDFPTAPPGGARIAARVRLLDLYRTLLDATGLACPPEVQGRSLLEGLRSGTFADEPAIALDAPMDWRGEDVRWLQGVRAGRFALLRELGAGTDSELYDVAVDPGERAPLGPEHSDVARELTATLDAAVGDEERLHALFLRGGATLGEEPDAATLEEIERLGYLGGDEDARAEQSPAPPER